MNYRHGSHSVYDLKYHIVFCTKYRYRVLTGGVSTRCREIIREVCQANYIDIVSGSINPDHVYLLLSIPPSISLSKAVQYIKGKSSRKLDTGITIIEEEILGSASLGKRLFCSYSRKCKFRRSTKIHRKKRRWRFFCV